MKPLSYSADVLVEMVRNENAHEYGRVTPCYSGSVNHVSYQFDTLHSTRTNRRWAR